MDGVSRYCLSALVVLGTIAPSGVSSVADPPTAAVQWTVDLQQADSGWATVRARIPRAAVPRDGKLRIVFRDLRPGRGGRVEDLAATVENYGTLSVRTDATPQGLACTLSLPDDAPGLTLRYRIDPTYYPPGLQQDAAADARSRLTADLAALRTTALWPVGDLARTHGEVRFLLPDGWQLAWPWAVSGDIHHLPAKALRYAEYFAAGQLEKQFLKLEGTRVHLARAPEADEIRLDALARLLHVYRTLMGGAPEPTGANYLVAVVPSGFMRGGAAGRFTAVQPPDPHTLAHELFHWWNAGGDYAADARWFAEGFTEYVALDAAVASGLMTSEERRRVLADLQAELAYLERAGIVSLVDDARASRTDARASRRMYAKGALVAHAMAAKLAARGDKLSDFIAHAVFNVTKPVDSEQIHAAARRLYGDVLDPFFEQYVFGNARLPRRDFGPATGASGAARFLPPRSQR